MLRISPEGGFLEGSPELRLLRTADEVDLVIEACFSHGVRAVLLYPLNLTPQFFDLSSGDAGSFLQKLRNYGIRLAVVCTFWDMGFSTRFQEMAGEENRGPHCRFVESRAEAVEWLGKPSRGT